MADEKNTGTVNTATASQASKREQAAATQGAQAVADAVKAVADAAVKAAQAPKSAASGDFTVSGSPGGRFRIQGNGFSHSGTVLLNGKQLETTGWGNENIYGNLPADAKSGEVTVWIDEKTQQYGQLTV